MRRNRAVRAADRCRGWCTPRPTHYSQQPRGRIRAFARAAGPLRDRRRGDGRPGLGQHQAPDVLPVSEPLRVAMLTPASGRRCGAEPSGWCTRSRSGLHRARPRARPSSPATPAARGAATRRACPSCACRGRPTTGCSRRELEDHLTHVPLSYAALRARAPRRRARLVPDRRTGRGALARARPAARPCTPTWASPTTSGSCGSAGACEITLRALAGRRRDRRAQPRTRAASSGAGSATTRPSSRRPVDVDDLQRPARERTEPSRPSCAPPRSSEPPQARRPAACARWPLVRREHPRARLLLNRPRDATASRVAAGGRRRRARRHGRPRRARAAVRDRPG